MHTSSWRIDPLRLAATVILVFGRGHLFIVDGDLTKVACTHVLVPTDASWRVEPWARSLCGEGFEELAAAHPVGLEWVVAGPVRPSVLSDDSSRGVMPSVWFANVEASGFVAARYSLIVDEFVERVAAVSSGRQLLAVNFLGSGRGGSAHDKGALIESLVAALLRAVAVDRGSDCLIDVVLVTQGRAACSAAQRARQRVTGSVRVADDLESYSVSVLEPMDVPDPLAVRRVVRRLSDASLRQRLVPLVGAGVGVGAGWPRWGELLRELGARAEVVSVDGGVGSTLDVSGGQFLSLDARDQAEALESMLGRVGLRESIAEILSVPRHSLCHALVATADPHHVVTTNYDTLMEDAFPADRRPAVLPRESVGADGRWVLKLHGDVVDQESIVLTRGDYLGLPGGSQALLGIMQAMLMTQHMLFIGYSLQDDTFHRVMFDVRKALRGVSQDGGESERAATVLLVSNNDIIRGLWGETLDVVALHHDDASVGGRNLEIVMDLVAFESADVSAFLLDRTYSSLLTHDEVVLRDRIYGTVESAGSAGPVGAQVLSMLRSLTGDS